MKYNCTIYDVPSEKYFKNQCAAIEKHIPNLAKEKLLADVDGSLIQIYNHAKGEIRVCNDYMINCLYVESDFDLEPYFKETHNDIQ